MENFFLGLDYLRSLGLWRKGWGSANPKWEDGYLYLPCYNRSLPDEKERSEYLESLGFSWSITGCLRYPIEQGRLI